MKWPQNFVKNANKLIPVASAEAVQRPRMRFVPLKTDEQLDLQALHRVRERLMSQLSPRVRKRGFLITRRFESEPSASSPKRSGGLSSRTCRRSCFVHDAAMCVNPSSASALIATADSATAAIFAGSRRGRNNDALLTGATSRQRLVEKPTSYVSAPIGGADAGLA